MSLDGRVIAIVEDDAIMGESLVQSLSLEGADARWWRSAGEARRRLSESRVDVVICDIRLPDATGEELFGDIARVAKPPPFLFVTAYGDIDQAVRLMRAGAGDYLTKPFSMEALLGRLGHLLPPQPLPEGTPVLGVSAAMRDVEATLRRVAGSRTSILLEGETGTGKDVAARFLHAISSTDGEPFVAVNCAAIPATLIESEIFGHERGAFTGADRRHLGYAERAGIGTLFLDEIGELPDVLQAKLLHLVEQRRFARIGGTTELPFKARIVAATNRRLEEEVEAGRFRADLYYRLAVLTVELAPLRARPEDIVWLLERFVAEAAVQGSGCVRGLSSFVVEAALAHPWPGNVRELRNRVERAVALTTNEVLLPADLFPARASQAPSVHLQSDASLSAARDAAERRRIESVLRETGGRIGAAAERLGISRTTLWERMRRFDIGDGGRRER